MSDPIRLPPSGYNLPPGVRDSDIPGWDDDDAIYDEPDGNDEADRIEEREERRREEEDL